MSQQIQNCHRQQPTRSLVPTHPRTALASLEWRPPKTPCSAERLGAPHTSRSPFLAVTGGLPTWRWPPRGSGLYALSQQWGFARGVATTAPHTTLASHFRVTVQGPRVSALCCHERTVGPVPAPRPCAPVAHPHGTPQGLYLEQMAPPGLILSVIKTG